MHSQFLTVEVNLIFRLVIATADVNFSHALHFQQFAFQTGCHTIGHRHIISVYLKVGTCLSRHTCITTSKDYLSLTELRISFQVFTHFIADCLQGNVTIARVHQTDVERYNVGTVVLHGSPCIIGVSLTNCIVTYFHNILILGHPLIRQFLRKFLRYLFTRTNRQLKLYGNTGIILCGEEFRTDPLCTQQADNEESNTSHDNNGTMTNRPVQHLCIPSIECVQRLLYRSEKEFEHLRRFLL